MKGYRIKKLREEKGLKQEELAKMLSISSSAIGMYERDEREPNDALTLKLSEFFQCSTDYLLGKSDIKSPENHFDYIASEASLGMSKEEYENLTDIQKQQIKDFALFIKKQS